MEDDVADILDLVKPKVATEKTIFPFGKYKGVEVGNVPASYLLWAYEHATALPENIGAYIEENMRLLEEEAECSENYAYEGDMEY